MFEKILQKLVFCPIDATKLEQNKIINSSVNHISKEVVDKELVVSSSLTENVTIAVSNNFFIQKLLILTLLLINFYNYFRLPMDKSGLKANRRQMWILSVHYRSS